MTTFRLLAVAGALACASAASAQYNILVIEQGHPYSDAAISHMQSLGYGVTRTQTVPNDFLAYDQVWDMRYATNMTQQDEAKARQFLAAGGRMLVLGEHGSFEGSRNISLRQWISNVGAGQVGNFVESCRNNVRDPLTPFGLQFVNTPNDLSQGIFYDCATTYSPNNITQGNLVAEAGGSGGVIAWNFGDINGAPNTRLLAVWDIEVWRPENGQNLTENFAVYLGRIPSPGAAALLGLGGLAAARRRRA